MRRLFLLICAFVFASPAHAEWWEARTDHFIVYSESSAEDAKSFTERLERFDLALRQLQQIELKPIRSDAQRLTVFRSGNTDYIGQLAGSPGVAGFYIPRITGSVSFTPAKADLRTGTGSIYRRDKRTDLDPASVLLHEYTHHFMYQHFSAAYPLWYSEGFAETAATIVMNPDGSFHVGNPPQYRSDALFSGMMRLSIEKMLTSKEELDFMRYYGSYTYGWLLNHYLSFDPSRKGQLTTYLRLLNQGVDSAQAARQAFGDLRKLDADVNRYKNSGRLGGADVRPANYTPPVVTLRKLGPDEEAIMPIRIRSSAGVNRKKARDVAAEARGVAARYPQSLPVQLALAEAELDAEQYDAAEAAMNRALALKPNSVNAMLLKSAVYLERGKTDKTKMPMARDWAARAYKADPYQPGSLLLNYLTYWYEGTAAPETALVGLERAFEMAPYDQTARMVLARQLLAEKKGDLARTILIPLAVRAHESKDTKPLGEVVKLIEQNKVDEAYKKLVELMKKAEDEAKKD